MLCSLLLWVTACEKDDEPSVFAPQLETGEAGYIYRKGSEIQGTIRMTADMKVKDFGVLYATSPSLSDCKELKAQGLEDAETFYVPVGGLDPGVTYYYAVFARTEGTMVQGNIESFTTSESNPPVFETVKVSDADRTGFTLTTSLLDDGGDEPEICGFCYKLADGSGTKPTIADGVMNVEAFDGYYSVRIADLQPEKEYWVCAYGTNKYGIGYGRPVKVKTVPAIPPTLSTVTLKGERNGIFNFEASVLTSGSSVLTETGFCWSSENDEPILANLSQAVRNNGNNFSITIGNLFPYTKYYIRAYAKNQQGVGYGEVFTFTTGSGQGEIGDISKLIGKWTVTKKVYVENGVTGQETFPNEGTIAEYFEFNINGATRWTEVLQGGSINADDGTYSYNSGTHKLTFVEYGEEDEAIVLILTDKELVLHYEDDQEGYTQDTYCTRYNGEIPLPQTGFDSPLVGRWRSTRDIVYANGELIEDSTYPSKDVEAAYVEFNADGAAITTDIYTDGTSEIDDSGLYTFNSNTGELVISFISEITGERESSSALVTQLTATNLVITWDEHDANQDGLNYNGINYYVRDDIVRAFRSNSTRSLTLPMSKRIFKGVPFFQHTYTHKN